MQKSLREHSSLILGALILLAALGLFFCLPLSAQAATGTLGKETPYVYCTYKDSDGKEVDGNKLDAGTYEVTFNVKDMTSASVLQVTASYGETVTVDSSTVAQLTDTDTEFSSIGYLASDGNIVFGYVSNADDTSALTADGTALFSLDVTFAEPCDAAKVITVASDPNLTFALADYGDGYDDEYAIDLDESTSYSGERYKMLSDVSPEMGHSVNGTIEVATDATGASAGFCVAGEYTVDLYADAEKATAPISATSAFADGANTFAFAGLSDGTYYATITSEYSIVRDNVKIIVNGSDITNAVITVVPCEFDGNGAVTSDDAKFVFQAALNPATQAYCDFDNNGAVTSDDAKYVYKMSLNSALAELTIQ